MKLHCKAEKTPHGWTNIQDLPKLALILCLLSSVVCRLSRRNSGLWFGSHVGIKQLVFGGQKLGDWEEGMLDPEDGYKKFKI